MKTTPFCTDESERLQTLVDYNILDTPPEVAFDELAAMASQICHTPIALISLVDRNRQWFKARVGISQQETSREVSFCAQAIQQSDVLVVTDPQNDERFQNNPLVTGNPHIRFYAGAPLISSTGHAVGTLCVIDHQQRKLSEDQIRFLSCLSRQVVAHLELRQSLIKTQSMFKELQNCTRIVSEQQLTIRHQEKKAALGGLASGLAHEINNPLAILKGLSSVANSMIQSNTSFDELMLVIKKIETNVSRLATVVSSLDKVCSQPMENFADGKSIEDAFILAVSRSRQSA